MIQDKKLSLAAFELIYDIETSLKRLLRSTSPPLSIDMFTFSKTLNYVILNSGNSLTHQQHQYLEETKIIRNKVCHMKPVTMEELNTLQTTHEFIVLNPTPIHLDEITPTIERPTNKTIYKPTNTTNPIKPKKNRKKRKRRVDHMLSSASIYMRGY